MFYLVKNLLIEIFFWLKVSLSVQNVFTFQRLIFNLSGMYKMIKVTNGIFTKNNFMNKL